MVYEVGMGGEFRRRSIDPAPEVACSPTSVWTLITEYGGEPSPKGLNIKKPNNLQGVGGSRTAAPRLRRTDTLSSVCDTLEGRY